MRHLPLFIIASLVLFAAVGCNPPEPTPEAPKVSTKTPEPVAPDTTATTGATVDFATKIQPALEKYCYKCHSGPQAKAKLDLSAIKTNDDAKAHKDQLGKAAGMLESKKMPPAGQPQPSDADRAAVVAGLKGV